MPMLDAVVLAGCDENRQGPHRVYDHHPGNDSFSQVSSGIVDEPSYSDPSGEAILVICADGESGLMLRVCTAEKSGDVMAMQVFSTVLALLGMITLFVFSLMKLLCPRDPSKRKQKSDETAEGGSTKIHVQINLLFRLHLE